MRESRLGLVKLVSIGVWCVVKLRKYRKFEKLRSRCPLGSLVTIQDFNRVLSITYRLGLVVGTWTVQKSLTYPDAKLDQIGADPRARKNEYACGYLLLMCEPDVPLVHEWFNQNNERIKVVSLMEKKP